MSERLHPQPSTVTLVDLADADHFVVGQAMTIVPHPRWWKRLWRWVGRRVFRIPPPPPLRVVAVDREAGTIALDCDR